MSTAILSVVFGPCLKKMLERDDKNIQVDVGGDVNIHCCDGSTCCNRTNSDDVKMVIRGNTIEPENKRPLVERIFCCFCLCCIPSSQKSADKTGKEVVETYKKTLIQRYGQAAGIQILNSVGINRKTEELTVQKVRQAERIARERGEKLKKLDEAAKLFKYQRDYRKAKTPTEEPQDEGGEITITITVKGRFAQEEFDEKKIEQDLKKLNGVLTEDQIQTIIKRVKAQLKPNEGQIVTSRQIRRLIATELRRMKIEPVCPQVPEDVKKKLRKKSGAHKITESEFMELEREPTVASLIYV